MIDTITKGSDEHFPHPNDPVSDEYMELKNEPVLYEWEIEVQQYQSWLVSVVIGGGFLLLWIWTSFKDGEWFISPSSAFLFLGVVSVFSGRYLALPNQLFHYSLTPKGVYYTKRDKLPDNFYLVINMLGWLLVLVSLVTVAVIGPFALVGAGGGAFMAMGMTKMRAKVSHLGAYFTAGGGELYLYRKSYALKVFGASNDVWNVVVLHCLPDNFDQVYKCVKSRVPDYEEKEVLTRKEFGY
ncbi:MULTISPECIES: hypothetical protein [Plesiomonas]|uniref:hypothetical protein n=1 Tax=Plesiomonas TaxID=702 RepID=UPI0012629E2B|nr:MULTISPECIES: hypothetical protein [Plesiomonas]KAB7683201.1 hypothetical protein GBN23_03235 [Plesiomonas shigelloides]KAB7693464.1 hypothetical protein GBN28_00490 [Plesiomonas shigelloides]MCE5165461.1 hypothetical protein [Plesiomonas sp. PI-19]MCQ8858555.1 hypothetical protein [Plesiomonas shigelloides]